MWNFSSNNWFLGVWASSWFSDWEVSGSLKPWGSFPASVLLWLPLLIKALFSSLLEPLSPPCVLPLDSVNALEQAGRGWTKLMFQGFIEGKLGQELPSLKMGPLVIHLSLGTETKQRGSVSCFLFFFLMVVLSGNSHYVIWSSTCCQL